MKILKNHGQKKIQVKVSIRRSIIMCVILIVTHIAGIYIKTNFPGEMHNEKKCKDQ